VLPSTLSGVLLLAGTACDQASPGTAMQTAVVDTPARPPTHGLDSLLLADASVRAAALPRLYSLLVARHGELLSEQYYHGRTARSQANLKSASKSIISALVGIAIADGRLAGLDQRIAPFFRDDLPSEPDPRLEQITIEDLLSMRAGLESTSMRNYGQWVTSRNWVRYALRQPFVDEPGGRMLYSTGDTHLLSALLTRATGMSTLAYAREKLMRPLGIELPPWTRDPQGIYFGGNEMALRPRDLLAFGELYRNGGRQDGVQIVPEEWVRESWVPRTTSPFNGNGYGLGWWQRERRGHQVYFAWGYGGQFLFIVPDLELTAVMTSDPVSPRERGHNQALHEILTDYLIPAAEQGGKTPR